MLKRNPNALSPRLNDDQIYELAEMFRLMSDPSRLSIVLSCLAERVSVGEMAQRLRLSVSGLFVTTVVDAVLESSIVRPSYSVLEIRGRPRS